MLSVYSLTFFVANFIIAPYTCSLSDSNMGCTGFSVIFRFLFDEDVVHEHVLEGHVYRRSTVTKATECHGLCRDDCRCVSMNYITNSEYDNCELNEANRHLEPTSLRPKTGARYYELVRQYMVGVCYPHIISIFKRTGLRKSGLELFVFYSSRSTKIFDFWFTGVALTEATSAFFEKAILKGRLFCEMGKI